MLPLGGLFALSADAQRIEDDLAAAARGERDLDDVARRIESAALEHEEWEILYRLLLQVRLRRSPAGTDALVPAREPPRGGLVRLRALLEALGGLWRREVCG